MAIRAALWAAVSSKPQAEKVSNEEQLRMGHSHADRLGATVAAELVVPGESRNIVLFEDAARRIPAYAELKRLIDTAAIDVLIYLDRSRLGRQASLSLAVVALCTQAGIATYDMESPPATLKAGGSTDELLMGAIKSMNAQTEIDKLKFRHRMGMIGRVRKGLPANNLAYGYAFAYRQNGDKLEKYVIVNEMQAAVVRRIMTLYLEGQGGGSIADALNADDIAAPGSDAWNRHTVSNILANAHWYAGQTMINRHSRTGRPVVSAPGQWPALIDAATYEQIQHERDIRNHNRRVADTPYILSGVCLCMVCGATMAVTAAPRYGYAYIACRYRHGYVAVRDDVVLAAIRAELATLQSVDIDAMLDTGESDSTAHIAARIAGQKTIIDKAQASMRRVDDAYADGTMDGERYRSQVERIKGQILQAAAEIEHLQSLAAAEAEAGTRRQRLEHARDHAGTILESDSATANAYLRRLLRVWCNHKEVTSIEWL